MFEIPMRLRHERLRKIDELKTPDRLILQSFVQHTGYQLFLDMVMYEIAKLETEFYRTPPGSKDEIVARHAKVTAAWEVFETVQKRLQAEINVIED